MDRITSVMLFGSAIVGFFVFIMSEPVLTFNMALVYIGFMIVMSTVGARIAEKFENELVKRIV